MDRGAWWAAVHGVAQSQTRLKWLSMHACVGEGNGNPLQCSCLENPRDGAAVYGVGQSQTWLKRLSSNSTKLSSKMEQLQRGIWGLKEAQFLVPSTNSGTSKSYSASLVFLHLSLGENNNSSSCHEDVSFARFPPFLWISAGKGLSRTLWVHAKHSVKAGSRDSLGYGEAQDCSLESWPQ